MEDVLLKPKEDRRKLSNVPDKTNTRSNIDRRNITEIDRNTDMEAFIKSALSHEIFIIYYTYRSSLLPFRPDISRC